MYSAGCQKCARSSRERKIRKLSFSPVPDDLLLFSFDFHTINRNG